MTTRPTGLSHRHGWLFTGLHWEAGCPVLTAMSASVSEEGPRRSVTPGERVDWMLAGPRTCTGVWTGSARRACPASTPVPASGPDSQCPACGRADRGKQIARDNVPADDDREFVLYLAWFGPGPLIKVGLTAAERGRDRLLEQGALAFLLLAAGPYAAVRHAEKSIAQAGLAAERLSARAKSAAWLNLPEARDRAADLSTARASMAGRIFWPDDIAFRSAGPIDQAADFGLDKPLSQRWQEVTAISDGAALSGRIRAVIGRQLLLQTVAGLLLCDMRRLAGWTIRPLPADADTAASGLALAAGPAPGGTDGSRLTLF